MKSSLFMVASRNSLEKPFNVIETWVGVHSITSLRNLKL